MAVSGRKMSDCKGTVSKHLEEDPDDSCGPCSAFDKRTEPHGYCVDCHEYLCKDCFIYHQKVKATKHHQLLDKSHIRKKGIPFNTSEVCTERCSTHKNEVIKFYCPKHDVLGCTDCMTLNHRTCDLDYIPDNCKDIGDSDEYTDAIRKLEEKSKKVKDIMSKAAVKDKEIDQMHDTATKEMVKYRQEINDCLDNIQRKSQTEANNRRSSDKQEVQSVIASCTAYSSEINRLQSSLQDSKTRNENGQLFIDLQRAKAALTTSMQEAERSLDMVNVKYFVKRNDDIQSILFNQHGLVNICEVQINLPAPPSPKPEIRSLKHKEDINVKTNTDKETCNITGCEILTADKLALADWNNQSVKIVDLQKKPVTDEKILDSNPFDIAVLPRDQIAVTIPNKNKILIMKTDKLAIHDTLSVEGYCYGITYHKDKLYVVCQAPRRVLSLDVQGNVEIIIPLQDESRFSGAQYISMGYDHNCVYVSTHGNSPVIRVPLQGKITAVCNEFTKDVLIPRGTAVLGDGSILICCYGSNEIHRLSKDLKTTWASKDGINYPRSICYSSSRNEVYVGSDSSDYLQVFRLQ